MRNRNKIEGIIINAVQFKKIGQQHGSFQQYLDSLDKSENYANVVKSLTRNFKRLGKASAVLFLYTVAEDVSPWEY